jgi:hypothetical protein
MNETAGTFWRRLDWRLWRQSYIQRTPPAERLAWVFRQGPAPEPAEQQPRCLAQVIDISLGGIVLAVSQRFESGTLLRVEIQGGGGDRAVCLYARVIQITHRTGGSYMLSCCFARELSDEELRLFGAERVRPKDSDVRAWVRFPVDGETTIQAVVTQEQERCRAKILNISAGGVAILAPRPIEMSTMLNLDLATADGQNLRSVKARVVHIAPRGENQWVLGCTFVCELSDEDVMALL